MTKVELIEWIESLQNKANQSNKFFIERNELYIEKRSLIKYIENELNLIENVYLLEETDEDVRRHLLTKKDIFENLLERIKGGKYE